MFHEFVHTIGLAAGCSPNHDLTGHASDYTNDIMWAGNEPLDLLASLDIGADDHFRHNNNGCLDLAQAGYITPLQFDYWLPEEVER